jgi:hypothetical protein
MQLLGASITPNPEFVSISLLVKQDDSSFQLSVIERTILVSPLSTISQISVDNALRELHNHLTYVIKASTETQSSESPIEDSVALELLLADERLLSSIQIYRPSVGYGMGLYYRLVRPSEGGSLFESLVSFSVSGNGSAVSAKVDLSKIEGVIFTVGISGLASAFCSSPLEYSLSQRVSDCFQLIDKVGVEDISATKQLLSSFLLWKDEPKISNAAVETKNAIPIPEHDDAAKSLVSPLRINRNKAALKSAENGPTKQKSTIQMVAANSAETARAMVDRMTLLSVSESQTLLRPYETPGLQRRTNLDVSGLSKSRFRRRKGDGKDADFDGFDFKGHVELTSVKGSLTPQSSRVSSTGSFSSFGKPPKQFKGPQKDTRTKGASVPALSAPRTDGQVRRKNKLQFDDDTSDRFKGGSSVASVGRIQVNIALNEDLSCYYKDSQLCTCSVEGIIQVSVLTTIELYGFIFTELVSCRSSSKRA